MKLVLKLSTNPLALYFTLSVVDSRALFHLCLIFTMLDEKKISTRNVYAIFFP